MLRADTTITIHRVRLNSIHALLAALSLFMTLLSIVGLLKQKTVFFALFGTVFFVFAGGAYIGAFLQVLVISQEDVKVKLAGITLRTIPLSEIQTIVYVSHFDPNYNYYVLSPKTPIALQSQGASVLYSDPYLRAKWERMGRKAQEDVIKIRAYYYPRFRNGYMKKEDGIWLNTSTENMDKIRIICPHATYVTTW